MTNHKRDRDVTIDRLLAGSEARGPADPAGPCLDADTLAAWSDDALDGREFAAAQAHAADCARCQLLLAAMAKTAPATAAASPWRMPSLRWLVPLTTAAAAAGVWLIVWIVLPVSKGPVTVREVSQIAQAEPPPAPANAPSDTVASPAGTTSSSRARRGKEASALDSGVEADRKVAEPPATNNVPDSPARNATADAQKTLAPEALASAASTATAAASQTAGGSAPAALSPLAATAVPATLPAAAAPPAPASPSNAVSPTAAIATRAFALRGRGETVVVSPNPASRWRIVPGGAVQRSADAGSTWQTQNTGVGETLSGGASPSPSVCWLVGPRGIVLLSTDGLSWKRVPFPEAVGLVAVRATDDLAATVTTADGREFVTEDGGRRWARAPGR